MDVPAEIMSVKLSKNIHLAEAFRQLEKIGNFEPRCMSSPRYAVPQPMGPEDYSIGWSWRRGTAVEARADKATLSRTEQSFVRVFLTVFFDSAVLAQARDSATI
jgi:hypothetical protein